ncbi:MAG TPA: hypothetical protein VGJ86_04705 [Acidimicrobiales bacterium]|jgi:hypothetical protein
MPKRVSISWVVVIWVVIGIVVAINKDYGKSLDTASQIATFLLAVVLWPIPATGGAVGITF